MPIYEFRCLKCGEIFEYLSLGKDEPLKIRCQNCHHSELERIMSRMSANMSSRGPGARTSVTKRKCSSGTCQSITIPGPHR
jgi:putative FmdB family regulatory protein